MVPNFEADTLGSALVTCADGKICAPGYEASGKGSEESVRPLDCKIVDIPRARREGIRQFVIGTDRVSTRVVLAVAETKLKNSRSIARVVETKFPRGSCPSFSSSFFSFGSCAARDFRAPRPHLWVGPLSPQSAESVGSRQTRSRRRGREFLRRRMKGARKCRSRSANGR
jgi:hypothetical protein